ncbi:hypothetical protein [Parabacteroides sp.]
MKTMISTKQILLLVLLILIGTSNGYASYQERAYLQTDKRFYISGELLWLKLYTTNIEGKLSSFSKVGYVELLNDSIPEVQIRLDLTNGTGSGWMELPVTLPTGYYRLVAYTRYMQNEGEDVFFEKRITVVNPYLPQETPMQPGTENHSFKLPDRIKSNHTITVSTDKDSYRPRNKGIIHIQGLPDDSISFSVSVAGADPVQATAPSIQDWKESLSTKGSAGFTARVLPEYEGPIYEGQLIDRSNNQPATEYGIAGLLSFPGENIQVFNGQTDKNGHITFYTGMTHGKKEMATVVLNTSGKSYRINLQSPFARQRSETFPPIYLDSTWHRYLLERSLGVQVMQVYTGDSINRIESANPHGFSKPYKSYILDEYTRFPFIEEILTEFIPIARINKKDGKRTFSVLTEKMDRFSTQTLVLFDNIPITDQEQIYNYNPLLLKKIDVYLGHYIFGGQRFDGILSFSTYKGNYQGIKLDPATQLFDKGSTQATRYFYMPAYEGKDVKLSGKPDFRHTLLWIPSLQSNGQREITVPFYTSDLPGDYVITVEGIGRGGTTVNATYTIQVRN